jgi:hypothetical protein
MHENDSMQLIIVQLNCLWEQMEAVFIVLKKLLEQNFIGFVHF